MIQKIKIFNCATPIRKRSTEKRLQAIESGNYKDVNETELLGCLGYKSMNFYGNDQKIKGNKWNTGFNGEKMFQKLH